MKGKPLETPLAGSTAVLGGLLGWLRSVRPVPRVGPTVRHQLLATDE